MAIAKAQQNSPTLLARKAGELAPGEGRGTERGFANKQNTSLRSQTYLSPPRRRGPRCYE
jgi:hypothetical protein